jgi:hypothetical protein
MPSQKLVRCEIRRAGEAGAGSARYVPLEIFGLWEYLMSRKHGFEVDASRASLWLDMEDAPEAAYGEDQYERVTEVTVFVYSERDDMFTRVCRYFPTSECETLKPIFLAHYPSGGKLASQVRERPGIWIRRNGSSQVGTEAPTL